MRRLGMIGGTGPESTVEYYHRLIAKFRARTGGTGAPWMIINSIDNQRIIELFNAQELERAADLLVEEIERLARAGADFGLIAANTPHLVFDEVQRRTRIPLLSIVEATCDAAAAAGLRRLALFGTRFTMGAAMFPEAFARHGMSVVMPNDKEQEFIHAKYMGELFFGTILDATRAALLEILQAMIKRDTIDGLILGGTELSLIFREPTAAGLPVLDTTQIHVDAAIERLLES